MKTPEEALAEVNALSAKLQHMLQECPAKDYPDAWRIYLRTTRETLSLIESLLPENSPTLTENADEPFGAHLTPGNPS